MESRKECLKDVKRIVVKIGTTSITQNTNTLNLNFIYSLAYQVNELRKKGIETILVTSGAIGIGMQELGLNERPRTTEMQQACAAIGQHLLMAEYGRAFKKYGISIAQILLTYDALTESKKLTNLKQALLTLVSKQTVPVINENDVVAVDEIGPTFGDNDKLSALVAAQLDAQLLIMLTNTSGLFDKNPLTNKGAKLITHVDAITKEIEDYAFGKSELGKGGMISKINAAKLMLKANKKMIIANHSLENILLKIMNGEEVGTLFCKK